MTAKSLAAASFLWACACGHAAAAPPSSVSANYDIYKAGLKIGEIVETFTRDQDRYALISTTRAVGLLAVFQPGRIILTSNGLINSHGLQPLHFRDRRESDQNKERRADFDWDTRRLTLTEGGQKRVFPLPEGTQDRLSAMYQFMFLSLANSDRLDFHMTNGSKLDIYNYRITAGRSVTVPLGTFKALYVASVPEPGVNRTEIWLAQDHAGFPYKMVITAPDGGKLSQELTRFDYLP